MPPCRQYIFKLVQYWPRKERWQLTMPNAEAQVCRLPLAVESLGGWSHEAALQISRIGRLVGQRLDTTPAETVSHLFQRLSICLWRGNAKQLCLMGTFRYTLSFTVIVCTCFCICFCFLFGFLGVFLFCLRWFWFCFACILLSRL